MQIFIAYFVYFQVIFGLCINSYSELTWNGVYEYPRWAILIGWLVASISVIMIPLVVVIQLTRAEGSLKEVFD